MDKVASETKGCIMRISRELFPQFDIDQSSMQMLFAFSGYYCFMDARPMCAELLFI